MEAAVQKNIKDERAQWHIPCHGNMKEDRPDGVFRLLGGQLNSAATARTRDRCITDLDRIIKSMGRTRWRVLGGGDKLVLPSQNTAAGLMVSSIPRGGVHIHSAQQE
jgi:hypothetical protein